MSNKAEWTSRTIIDAVGEAGSVDLDEELVARTGWMRGTTSTRLGSWTR